MKKTFTIVIIILSITSCNQELNDAKNLSQVSLFENDYGEKYYTVEKRKCVWATHCNNWSEVKRFQTKDSAEIFRKEIIQKDLNRLLAEKEEEKKKFKRQ